MHHEVFKGFNFLRNKELNELYASIAIRTFSLALIGLFIPIYLYQLGYSFSSIFVFFGFAAFFNFLLTFPAAKLSSRFGLKRAMLFSMPFLIIFFLLLFSLERFSFPLWLLALSYAFHASFYWFSYHTEFSKFSRKTMRGKQVGFSKVIIYVFGALGPLLGGLILSFFGFKVLFILVSFLLLASTFPLFLSREVHEPMKFSFKGFFQGQKIREILAYMGSGIETRIGTILWPLFVFIFIFGEKYVSLGAVSSLALVMSITATLVISKFSDLNLKSLLRFGVVATAIVWFFKSFIKRPFQVFIADAVYGVTLTSIHIPFDAINYNKIRKRNRTKIILEREVYIKLGAAIFLFLASLFTNSFVELFRYGGPLSALLHFFF
jgi:MFS family permease